MMEPEPTHDSIDHQSVRLTIVVDKIVCCEDSFTSLSTLSFSNINNCLDNVFTVKHQSIADGLDRCVQPFCCAERVVIGCKLWGNVNAREDLVCTFTYF